MGSIRKACVSGFLCRLCSEMHRIVFHIYGDQGQRLCLVEKINGYLPIKISPTDPLPKTICEICLHRVQQHYDFLIRLSAMKKNRFPQMKAPARVIHGTSLESSLYEQRNLRSGSTVEDENETAELLSSIRQETF